MESLVFIKVVPINILNYWQTSWQYTQKLNQKVATN